MNIGKATIPNGPSMRGIFAVRIERQRLRRIAAWIFFTAPTAAPKAAFCNATSRAASSSDGSYKRVGVPYNAARMLAASVNTSAGDGGC